MRKIYEYSHFGGTEVLEANHPETAAEIDAIIADVRADAAMALSQYSQSLRQVFYQEGYRELCSMPPRVATETEERAIQVDFAKDRVLLQVRFGDSAEMFYDMVAFQHLYNERRADVGVMIAPSAQLCAGASATASPGERLISDLLVLGHAFPTMPLKIILIGIDHTSSARTALKGPRR